MATVKKLPPPVLWVEPPVSKEDALNPRPDDWFSPPLGYQGNGGDGPPSDAPLDRMIYPRDCGPSERQAEEREQERRKQAEKFREERLQRSRSFDISDGNVLGDDPGPPSSFKED